MSGWTEISHGSVKIKHYSTSSQVKISVTRPEEISQGHWEDTTQELWLEYSDFTDLKTLIKKLWDI